MIAPTSAVSTICVPPIIASGCPFHNSGPTVNGLLPTAREATVGTEWPTGKDETINKIFGPGGRLLGWVVESEVDVVDADGIKVGEVHRAGGGDVSDARDRFVGEVFANGVVEDDNANEIGYVLGRSVYDRAGAPVGTVDAETTTTWITGISDAHKAGAALLLLLRNRPR